MKKEKKIKIHYPNLPKEKQKAWTKRKNPINNVIRKIKKDKEMKEEKKIGIHGNNCPHCVGGLCECFCEICRPNMKEEKIHKPDDIELLPTPASSFSQERINSEVQDKVNEIIKAVNKLTPNKL